MTEPRAARRYIATVEPVSSCPVNCEMCPVSRRDIAQPKAQLMSLDTAGIAAARLRHEFGVDFAWWGNWGEPLVHPGVLDLVRVFARVGIGYQMLSSSFSAKFDVERLVASDLAQVDVSISGITAEVYNRGHVDGKWDLIERNLDELARVRERNPGSIGADIRWHRYKHNEHQLEDARRFASERGMGFKPYYAHLGGIDALDDFDRGTLPPKKAAFVRESVFLEFVERIIAKHVGGTSCSMNANLVIHSDGRLLHCCSLMASHQTGVDFLTLPKDQLVAYKDGPNGYCAKCLSKGWAGFTMSSKTDVDLEGAPALAPSTAIEAVDAVAAPTGSVRGTARALADRVARAVEGRSA